MSRARRWGLIAIALIVVASIGIFIAYQIALDELRSRVIKALGTESEVGETRVSFKDIEITALKLSAPAGWPRRDNDRNIARHHRCRARLRARPRNRRELPPLR